MQRREIVKGDVVRCDIPVPQWNNKLIRIKAKVKSIKSAYGRNIYTLTKGTVLNDIDVSKIETSPSEPQVSLSEADKRYEAYQANSD